MPFSAARSFCRHQTMTLLETAGEYRFFLCIGAQVISPGVSGCPCSLVSRAFVPSSSQHFLRSDGASLVDQRSRWITEGSAATPQFRRGQRDRARCWGSSASLPSNHPSATGTEHPHCRSRSRRGLRQPGGGRRPMATRIAEIPGNWERSRRPPSEQQEAGTLKIVRRGVHLIFHASVPSLFHPRHG